MEHIRSETLSVLQLRFSELTLADFQEYSRLVSAHDRCMFILSKPILVEELKRFHTIQWKQVQEIAYRNPKATSSKKLRKTMSFLDRLISRAATRATPARFTSVVVNTEGLAPQCLPKRLKPVVSPYIYVRQEVPRPESGKVSRNPSVLRVGDRWHLTAPRSKENANSVSIKESATLNFLLEQSSHGIELEKLIELAAKQFDENVHAVREGVKQLINREFLLPESAGGFLNNYCDSNSFRVVEMSSQLDKGELTTTRYAQLPLGNDINDEFVRLGADLVEAYQTLARFSAFDEYDTGVSRTMAAKLYENYGNVAIPVTLLANPNNGTGLANATPQWLDPHRTVQRAVLAAKAKPDTSVSNFVELSNIDLAQTNMNRSLTIPTFLMNSAVVGYLCGEATAPTLITADGLPGVPKEAFIARFSTENSETPRIDSGGTVFASLETQPVVNKFHEHKLDIELLDVDWFSPESERNLLKETSRRGRKLNVNSPIHEIDELSADSLRIVSDGTYMHLLDPEGREVAAPPGSMVNIDDGPSWLQTVILSSTTGWLRPVWTWRGFDQDLDYLPGVRWKNVVLSRPMARLRGPFTWQSLNDLCDAYGFGDFIRVGAYDKKPMFYRKNENQAAGLMKVLKQGNGWVYDTLPEEFSLHPSSGRTVETVLSLPGLGVQDYLNSRAPTNEKLSKLEQFTDCHERMVGFGLSGWNSVEFVCDPGMSHFVLGRLFGGYEDFAISEGSSGAAYFLRYLRKTDHVLRLRYPRADVATEARLHELIQGGMVRDVREELHANEVERYGGWAGFVKACTLFATESRLVATLEITDDLSLQQWKIFAHWWAILSEVIPDGRPHNWELFRERLIGSHSAGPIPPAFADELSERWRQLRAVDIDIAKHRDDLAHMFLNRLGVGLQDEKKFRNRLRSIAASTEKSAQTNGEEVGAHAF